MNTDPLAPLRKHYTREQVREVYERFDTYAALPLCSHFADVRGDKSELRHVDRYGHKEMFKSSYFDLPEILEALGGAPIGSTRFFWEMYDHDPLTREPIVSKWGQAERMVMLAFMLTWLEDDHVA